MNGIGGWLWGLVKMIVVKENASCKVWPTKYFINQSLLLLL